MIPDLVAVVVEDEASVRRRREPKPLRKLALELARRPAGIAEGDQAVAGPALVADVAKDLGAGGHGEAAVDVERVGTMIIGAVDHKADAGLDGAARENPHRSGNRRVLVAERREQ